MENSKRCQPKTLAGFMELMPNEQILFNSYVDIIKKSYESFGFLPIDTPIIECADVLLAKAGGETEKQIYRFTKGENDLALRFDLTVPLAKYIAMRSNQLEFPFRRYQIGKVYRGERPQKGRYREFYQCDVDIVAEDELNLANDAELVLVIYNTFKQLNFGEFTIHINNRKILNGLFEYYKLSNVAQDILRIVDKLPKVGKEKVTQELFDLGMKEKETEEILEFLSMKLDNNAMLDKLKEKEYNDIYMAGVDELEQVLNCVKSFEVPENSYCVDLTIARGLDYYTGTVYETFLNGYESIGSVCSGGRYDNLAEYYTTKKLPGVGISIGITRLFYQLQQAGLINQMRENVADVLIIPMESYEKEAYELSTIIRGIGVKTQVYLENKKLKTSLKYADRLKITYVVVVGEDEIKSQSIVVKNMLNGEKSQIKLSDIKEYFKSVL